MFLNLFTFSHPFYIYLYTFSQFFFSSWNFFFWFIFFLLFFVYTFNGRRDSGAILGFKTGRYLQIIDIVRQNTFPGHSSRPKEANRKKWSRETSICVRNYFNSSSFFHFLYSLRNLVETTEKIPIPSPDHCEFFASVVLIFYFTTTLRKILLTLQLSHYSLSALATPQPIRSFPIRDPWCIQESSSWNDIQWASPSCRSMTVWASNSLSN